MKNYDILADTIDYYQLTPEEVLNLFIYWYGQESITDEFIEHVEEEIGI